MIRIRCVVERITFQNSENGYTVLKAAVKGDDELVTVVGNLLDANVGSVLLIEDLKRSVGSKASSQSKEELEHNVRSHLKSLQLNPYKIRSFFNSPYTKYAA